MCIITSPVRSVAKTQIYVSASNDTQRQLTIYSNQIDSLTENNRMILPVPFPDTLTFVNLQKYGNLFKDMDRCFRSRSSLSHLYASAPTRSLAPDRTPLPVFAVGSYTASIVPSIDDWDRLDASLCITEHLQTMLREHYGKDFGFIVCRLKQGDHAYHPFAYTHKFYKPHTLFVPTRHYHVHPGPDDPTLIETDTADWDHEIYSPMTDLRNDNDHYCVTTDYVQWNRFPKEYRWAAQVELGRWIRKGNNYPNIDLTTRNYYVQPGIHSSNSFSSSSSSVPSSSPVVPVVWSLLGQPIEFWDRLRKILGVT